MRTVREPLLSDDDVIEDADDRWRKVSDGLMSDAMKLQAYEEWQVREAEWCRTQ